MPAIRMVSTHASAREATITDGDIVLVAIGFYPRLREGGDSIMQEGPIRSFCVSTHASAREATVCRG